MRFGAVGVVVVALVAAGCGGAVVVESLPLDQPFDDCGGFTMNDDVSTIDCTDGQLRMVVSKPEVSATHYVPFRFQPEVPVLIVSTELRVEKGDGSFGIGCDSSEPGEPGRGYLFVVQPYLRGASIVRMGGAAGLEWLAFRHVAVDVRDSHRLRATCSGSAGGTVLRLDVDGRRVLDIVDRKGIDSFGAAVTVVMAGAPTVDGRFEQLQAETSSFLTRSVEPAADPLAYRYEITMVDTEGDPVTTVSLGDELLVVVDAPDLPRDRSVRARLCVDRAAKRACWPANFDGGSSYVTGWSVDPGEEANGRFRLSVRVEGREVAATSASLVKSQDVV